jgi:hypothetical protein
VSIVTDIRVCVDPGGNGATMNVGGEGGPSPPGREEVSSWYPAAETVRGSQDARRQRRQTRSDIKATLCTEYVSLYALTCCILNDCGHEQCFTCLSVSGE